MIIMSKRKILSIVVIMIITLNLFGCSSKDNNGYFNNIKWFTSFSEVEKSIKNKYVQPDRKDVIMEIINDFDNIVGTQIWIAYEFDNEKLSKIISTPMIITDKTKISNDEMQYKLYQAFIDKYGEYDEEKDNRYIWNKKYSKITLYKSNSYYFMYEPIK